MSEPVFRPMWKQFNRGRARHDGGTSRVCIHCGGVGCRTRTLDGWAHRRCLTALAKEARP